MPEITALRAALAAEHAAIFAYGRLGVLLDPDSKAEAQGAEAVHRARRDQLLVQLDQLKATPEPAQPGYVLPFAVTDRASALKLAIHVEDAVAATWREAVPGDRQVALAAFTDAAVRATRWRRIAGIAPLTSTFPGRKS